ncbi:MAG: TonB-dependent receptor [Bacteroidetes bacterium]|nr:TonB-dependent receptor [Bacteroidota bacterium]
MRDIEKIISFKIFSSFMMLLALFVNVGFSGTTGKLSGYVHEYESGEALIGANVIIEGTFFGAATDFNGYYYINNIPPGEYRVIVSAVGYQKITYEKVLIKIDLTTKLNVKLKSTVIQLGQDVIVTADRPLVQRDLTSTSATVTSSEIKMMPVEDINQIVNLQAGVIGGHFRGGRSNDVAYLIDGVSVTDAFSGGFGVEIENTSIRQMEVISGTFNAEYGQALSGVVNIVTQSGSNKYEASVNAYVGNYVTSHTGIFRNLDRIERIPTRNVQFTFSGPTKIVNNLTFFLTGRYYDNNGYLFGRRVYNVWDDVPLFPNPLNKSIWIPQNTGDGAFVRMNPDRKYSLNGKLSYSSSKFNVSYGLIWDDNFNKYYDHYFSWTPDGIMNHFRTNWIHSLQFAHYPSQETFQTFKLSYNRHDYKGYLYEDTLDSRYVDPRQGIAISNYTFRSGGNQGGRYKRYTNTLIGQWALSSQISKEHKISVGIESRLHEIFNHWKELINLTEDQTDSAGNKIFTPAYPNEGVYSERGSNQLYIRKPYEISAYIQDKMEYDIMIINAGIRFDYFNPNSKLPLNKQNPTKNPNFPGYNEFVNAKSKFQISPRLGASFPITDQGILRFSYGHFFKIPNFENLYQNPDFIVIPGISLSSIMGNPDLNVEKTIMYEIGLQQVLFPNFVLNTSLYYRDIRNWLGMEIVNTYEGFKYARFINRDYANVRGLIVTLDKRFADYFGFKVDYTFQIAEGNASDPYSVYNNNQTSPPIEETKKVVPLDWDQRHTLNLSVTVGDPGDWNLGFVFQYGSGWPYTEDIRISQGVRFENGGLKPWTYNLDLRAEKGFDVFGLKLNTFLLIYNLLDIKNEYGIYASTGRASTDLNIKYAGELIGINTIDEYVNNPGMYSAPREIRVGFGFSF